MAPRVAPLALALAAVAVAPGVALAEGPAAVFLATVEVESAPGLTADVPLRATLELNPAGPAKLASLREWFPGARATGGRVAVVLDGRAPTPAVAPTEAQRRATFLVDFDQPAAAALREALAGRDRAPSDEDLARLVDGWITRKSMTRAIDVASRVAAHREGDCSEHAVLLAAAARIAGRAARVVFGIALFPVEGRLRGFGHAWAEIHDGRAWHTVDATSLPGVRYLPLGAISDEGPGYLVAAWGVLSPLDVRRVVLEPAR